MIEQLAEHGVTAEDLTPTLVATYTVDNPDYDPEAEELAARQAEEADITNEIEEKEKAKGSRTPERRSVEMNGTKEEVKGQDQRELEDRLEDLALGQAADEGETDLGYVKREVKKIERRASEANTYDSASSPLRSPSRRSPTPQSPSSPSASLRKSSRPHLNFDDDEEGGGDIGAALDEPPTPRAASKSLPPPTDYVSYSAPPAPDDPTLDEDPPTPRATSPRPSSETSRPEGLLAPLPSSLPGVSKTLTAADKTVTLDIRWTILCDLFLALIADSVYDARSRVLLGRMAEKLGLEWNDVVRFERRLTEALEIQEAVKQKEHTEVLEGRRQKDKRTRYMMMGLATLGKFHHCFFQSSETHLALLSRNRWRSRYRFISWITRSCHRSWSRRSLDDGRSDGNIRIPGGSWRSCDHFVRSDSDWFSDRRKSYGEANTTCQDL